MSGPAEPAPGRRSIPLGRLVLGLLLLLAGVGWLLDSLGTDVPWEALLPAALVVVGVVLLATARSEAAGHGGLIALGIVLTVLLLASTTIQVPVGGGVGERRERPTSVQDLRERYRLSVGKLELDLRGVALDRETEVSARLGIGELIVLVPPDTEVRLRANVGMGDLQAFEQQRSGFVPDLEATFREGEGEIITLDLSVGIGSLKVEG